jgi:hypothetical protein
LINFVGGDRSERQPYGFGGRGRGRPRGMNVHQQHLI